ncbi:DEAD/DEAH box helicase [Paenibacillus oryzae]
MPELLKALNQEQYTTPTPIQEKAIPVILEGKDLFGCAQTGTGKTAAFSLPILQLLHKDGYGSERGKRSIRSLILTPTRELALQIDENIKAYARYTRLRSVAIVGGVSQVGQERALEKGADILIATPGRLTDLINQKIVDLRHVQILVLDEADRMLDMGFIHEVKRIISGMPKEKQTLFFSATMPPEIAGWMESLLRNPVKVEITPVSSTVEVISQSLYFVDKSNKQALLQLLLEKQDITSALVFTRTKHGADRVAKGLNRIGVTAQAIHGNKSQNARQNALSNFKNGTTRILVATDIAARGIDIDELSYVINFNLPNIPETYVHRIGRTGRAGHSGSAISFCEAEELPYLKDIQKVTKKQIPVVEDHPYPMTEGSMPVSSEPEKQSGGVGQNRGGARGAKSSGQRSRNSSRPAQHAKTNGGGSQERQSGHGQVGTGQAGNGQSGHRRVGTGQAGNGQSGHGRVSNGRTGAPHPQRSNSGHSQRAGSSRSGASQAQRNAWSNSGQA